MLAYVAIVLLGLIPVNNDFVLAEKGITLHVVSNEVHADIIVPVVTNVIDWSVEFQNAAITDDVSAATHVAIGWGDKGFFLHTETWDDFKLSIAANALLLPSESCVHAKFTHPEHHPDAASVTISQDQYRQLVDFIKQTLRRDSEGKAIQIPGYAYSTTDAFFEAKGRYHLLNTCNSWVGRGLRTAGVKVPWMSPLPKTPMLYFE
ncbi:TIGR02117 family protein [Mariniblastus fucicola]|uniref:TIGR02117 family protein n=1 Tax=Mariniblastus fucicola TaxID=980251 RepID=UPI001AEFB3C5|nr:TIGR02117 family protein [Mariniblastus fucicola]